MLPKPNRLKKKKDFEEIFTNGKGFKEDFLYIKIKPNNLKNSRFGFIVGKKFSKRAVNRNKIKRKLRESVRIKLPSLKKGIDGVITVMPGFKVKDFQELEDKVVKLLQKARILGK